MLETWLGLRMSFFWSQDSFKNHDVYISVLTAERKKWEACAHVEKADEKHPSEDVVPVEVMVDEPDGALILGQGKATWGWQNRISFVNPKELPLIPAVQKALVGLGPFDLGSDVQGFFSGEQGE